MSIESGQISLTDSNDEYGDYQDLTLNGISNSFSAIHNKPSVTLPVIPAQGRAKMTLTFTVNQEEKLPDG